MATDIREQNWPCEAKRSHFGHTTADGLTTLYIPSRMPSCRGIEKLIPNSSRDDFAVNVTIHLCELTDNALPVFLVCDAMRPDVERQSPDVTSCMAMWNRLYTFSKCSQLFSASKIKCRYFFRKLILTAHQYSKLCKCCYSCRDVCPSAFV